MCQECLSKPVYEFSNKRVVCKVCFLRWFQKKFLYSVRKFGMIKKGDVVGYKKGMGFREAVLESLLEMFVGRAPVELVKIPNKKARKIALSDTTDTIAREIVEEVVKGDVRKLKLSPVDSKFIRPLFLFTDKEVELYAKLKKLGFSKIEERKTKLGAFVEELEKKHLEVKHAVVKSYMGMFN